MSENEAFIVNQVHRLVNRCGAHYCREMEDLCQVARLAFLEHIRKIADSSQIHACKLDILSAIWDYWVEMAVVKIPRHRYLKEISRIHYVSLDQDAMIDLLLDEREMVAHAEVDDFLDSLSQQERVIVAMKQDDCTNRAIMPYVDAHNEVQMSRMMKRIRKKAEDYFEPHGSYAYGT